MGLSPKQVRRRERLFKKNPFCVRCGVKMVSPKELKYKGTEGKMSLVIAPDNMCTYEHRFVKDDPRRSTQDNVNSILCNKCNMALGRINTKKLE